MKATDKRVGHADDLRPRHGDWHRYLGTIHHRESDGSAHGMSIARTGHVAIADYVD